MPPRSPIAKPELIFKEEDHSYWLDGRRLAGVTETISTIAPHWSVGEWYLQRGKAVHLAVSLALADQLDWNSVDPRIVGRVKSVLRFLRECKITPNFFERQFVSHQYMFAGTMDFYGIGQIPHDFILADWKGSISPHVEAQIGAYSLLLKEQGFALNRAVAVQTNDDESYKCRWFTTPQIRVAQQIFLSILTTRNWLVKNNLQPKKEKP